MSKREVFNSQPGGIVTPSVRFGNLVFTSGLVGRDAGGKLPPDLCEQARLTLTQMQELLSTSGTSMENVLQVSVFLANIEDRPAFNEVYKTFFSSTPPARTCVEAGRLGEGVLVEVACIAGVTL